MKRDRFCPACKVIWDKQKLGSDCPACKIMSFLTMNSGDMGAAMYLDESKLNLSNFKEIEEVKGIKDNAD